MVGYLKFFVAFNAENELIETEKSLQNDGHGEFEVLKTYHASNKIPNFQR